MPFEAEVRYDRLLAALRRQVFSRDPEYKRYEKVATPVTTPGTSETTAASLDNAGPTLANYIFDASGRKTNPSEVFEPLRWGGLYVCVLDNYQEAAEAQRRFHNRGGFVIDRQLQPIRTRFMGMAIPGLTQRGHWFAARKVELIAPGQTTDRFTYRVYLAPDRQAAHGYHVVKEVPSYDNVLWRLKEKHPQIDPEVISKRAQKLVDSVFPIFLTREAAILNLLQRDMPPEYRQRIPKVVSVEKDDRGFIRKLVLNWLRMGGTPMSQIEFAKQSADLLRVLHDDGGMMHLDLRLDNIVLSDHGVSFVDFGSAVRVGENLTESPLLTSLFEEMMRTSQIQKLLGKWTDEGKITSKIISDKLHKVDKAIDFFYLAVQMNRPHNNPEFRGLVRFNKDSQESLLISQLTGSILRPSDPDNATFKSARDILAGLEKIEKKLAESSGKK